MHNLYNYLFRQLSTLQLVAGPLLLILPLLASCGRSISILDIESESELVLYAFPTTDDEYLLNVSLTRPIAGTNGTLHLENIECTTNNRPDEVTFVHEETHYGMPVAIYRVKGEHHCGDKISISVKASAPSGEGKSLSAMANTTIPAATPMEVTTVDTISPKLRFLVHVRPVETDNAYYATRLTTVFDRSDSFDKTPEDYGYVFDDGPDEFYHSWSWTNFAPIDYTHLSIEPNLEPLLNHYSDLELDPWNEYYKKMYFFSSADVSASSQAQHLSKDGLVLHLQTEFPSQMDYIDVQFYTLSPEYYLMLHHLNDQLSNDFVDAGLAQTYSTYSNVRGGFGCVAAYACSHYKYVPPVIETDGMLY